MGEFLLPAPAPLPSLNRTGMVVGIVVGVGVVSFLSIFAVYCFVQKRKRQHCFVQKRNRQHCFVQKRKKQHTYEDEELLGMVAKTYTFTYAELKAGTSDFSHSNKLGEGGFGPVYKGTLEDGRTIAVKQLSVDSHQGKSQFVAEVATISVVQHHNLVKLYGCCYEGDNRLLVYEYHENKSLDKALFGHSNLYIDWPRRFEICLGVARGLAYLHEESGLKIIHRDIKASNILLDSYLNPKISDFGFAKLYDDKKTHISTYVAGTIGYLAPEYAMRGHLSEKADVFSFGVVALEIVSGRSIFDSNLEQDKTYLLEWVCHLHENNSDVDVVDEDLLDFNEDEVKRVIGVSLLCTQLSPSSRPSMPRVVAMLLGNIEVPTITLKPSYLTDWKFDDKTSMLQSIIRCSQTADEDPSVVTTSVATTDLNSSPLDNPSRPILHEIIGDELLGMVAKPYTFTYAELKAGTSDFSPSNMLGEGGFGPVYKGTLEDGRSVAIKQLSVVSREGKRQFVAEVATISVVQHRNLVKLYGCCYEGDNRLLVYEYHENKSLDKALFGHSDLYLDWPRRFEICLGVARGLAYLHEESRLKIVHRDIKASNILLDSYLNPKISDFGLAKLYDDKKTHMSTHVAGTIGYLAPEYAMRGHLTEKADVFSFGVVALEIVSGRSNSDSNLEQDKRYLLEWAWQLHENNSDVDVVDEDLLDFNEDEVKRVIGVSLLCTQASPTSRPSMSRVVAMLSGDTEVPILTSKPSYITDCKFDDKTSLLQSIIRCSQTADEDPSVVTTSVATTDLNSSPLDNPSRPILREIIGDGR